MPRKDAAAKRFEVRAGKGLSKGRPIGARVIRKQDRLEIAISDARTSNGQQKLDCSPFLEIGPLGLDLANALLRNLTRRSSFRSRVTQVSNLRHGLVKFLSESARARELSLESIDQEMLDEFFIYLGRTKSAKTGKRLSVSTRRHYVSSARDLIDELCRTRDLPAGLSIQVLQGRHDAKTAPLAIDKFAKFIAQCRTMILRTMDEVERDWKIAKGLIPAKSEDDLAFRLAFKAARKKYAVLPERKYLLNHDRTLFKAVSLAGYTRVRRAMHPASQDLTPFIYFFAAVTNFNQQTLLELSKRNIRKYTHFGQERLVFSQAKPRAHGYVQSRSFPVTEDKDNPAVLQNFLWQWTKAARKATRNPVDSLFAFVPRDRKNRQELKPIFDPATRLAREFDQHAPKFCKLLGYDKLIGTRLLRATGAEVARGLFPGNAIAVEELLGHANWKESHPSYRSDAAKKLAEQSLVGAMAARERWLRTKGKVDERAEGTTRDRRAATPGFICIDPFNSPIASERKGRLCSAYGFCPACPHAQPDKDEGYALARMLQLTKVIKASRAEMGTEAWKARCEPVLVALNNVWIPEMSNEATRSRAYRLKLSSLPALQ